MRQLHPSIRRLWRGLALAVTVGAVILVGAFMVPVAVITGNAWVPVGVAPVAVVGLAVAAVWPGRVYRAWGYELTGDALEIRHGVVWRTHSVVPYARVQNVDITSGPLERSLGLRTLALHTASASSDATIPGIDEAAAAELRRVILERAGRDDAA